MSNQPTVVKMRYRPEIDGLRAVAVLSVILAHAGFEVFGGGFVGVDIFFVISGYLITSILIADLQAGTFRLLNFYERRTRRILPALFVIMLVCWPFAWMWLTTADMESFSQSLIAVCVFASNVLFWKTSGYFESAAELKPLLHTWSLAVEEQYYVFFPLLLMLTWRLGRRRVEAMLFVMAIGSFGAAQWGSVHKPAASFYLLPTRGWELLIGALIAFYFSSRARPTGHHAAHHIESGNNHARQHPAHRVRLAQLGSATGLLMILYAIFAFDKQTPFPSVYTLVPTLGSGLLILFANGQTLTGRLLASKPFVALGLISYSAYLWHQPLFAFARHASLEEPGGILFATLTVAALLLGYLSWRFVETPFRTKNRFSRRQIFVFGIAGTVFFIILGAVGSFSKGFEYRLTAEQKKIIGTSHYDFGEMYSVSKCFMMDESKTFRDFSVDCKRVDDPSDALVLWGDSYAAALSPGLRALHGNLIQYTASGCPPVVDTEFPQRPNCVEINRFVIREIEKLKPREIYLAANWHTYHQEDVALRLRKTLQVIKNVSPSSRVVVIGGVPQWEPSLPVYALRKGVSLDREQYLSLPAYNMLEKMDHELKETATTHGAAFFSALNALCQDDKCLTVLATQDGRENSYELAAWDNGHLTRASALLLARKLLEGRLKVKPEHP